MEPEVKLTNPLKVSSSYKEKKTKALKRFSGFVLELQGP